MLYSVPVPIVACPFCREMFEKGEEPRCPVCGIELQAFEKLPPSAEALHEDGDIPVTPEHETLAFTYGGRGRGALLLLGVLGLALFFLPWVDLTLPYIDTFSGFDLAKKVGWTWGAAVGWSVLIPTVLTRRTIAQLRGARVAAGFLAAIPAVTVLILLVFPPHRGIVPIHFRYDWPLWASLAVSLLALPFAVSLGGRVDDIRVERGTSEGQALH